MKELADFLFEAGQLKRVKRSGWWVINVKDPETVAEHSFRAAVVGYVLGKLENADVKKVVLMCLFNDFHEARLCDLHKVSQRYIDLKPAENSAFAEQVKDLPENFSGELKTMFNEFQEQSSKEGIIARDADLLENSLQAREYIKQGYSEAQDFIDNVRGLMKTDSAKKLMKQIERSDPDRWWKGLKKITR